MTTAILLGLTVLLPAQSGDDPEPAPRKGLVTRLVAKKSTYKLDFGGKKKDDYVNDAKNGTAEAPKVELELVITNYTKENVRIRTASLANRLTLTLKGDGAVSSSVSTEFVKVPVQYAILEPKKKLSIPIDRLVTTERMGKGGGAGKRHYWTEPGEYKLSASLYTLIMTDFGGPNAFSRYHTFESQPLTLKVEK
jgi:hypothetical protein